MTISFPYNLQEGSIAYARHVMANFRAITNALDNLHVAGIDDTTLEGILASLVIKGEQGNADEILDDEGETLQEKLDRHAFDGRDASLYDGYAQFHVDVNGHLIVTLPVNDPTMYSIDDDPTSPTYKHLLLTVGESGDVDTVDFDLGIVKGDKGDKGDTGESGAVATTATISAAQWEDDPDDPDYRTVTVSCSGITATNNFILQPHVTGVIATDNTAAAAWEAAGVRVISQAAGEFTLYARGTIPATDITIDIIYGI